MKKLVSIAVACALATTMISCSNEVERGPKKHELTVNVAVKAGVDYKIDDLVSLSVVASNPAKDQQYEETDAVGKLPVVFSEAIEGDYTVTVVGIISDAIKLVGSAQASLYGDQSITVTLDLVRESPLLIRTAYGQTTSKVGGSIQMTDLYWEIVNNSDEVQYLDGVIIGSLFKATGDKAPYANEDGILPSYYPFYSRVFAFPGTGATKNIPIQPGAVVVIANTATNHATLAGDDKFPDLSNADYELFLDIAQDTDYPAPNLNMIFTGNGSGFQAMMGFSGGTYLIARIPEGVDPQEYASASHQEGKVDSEGKPVLDAEGNQVMQTIYDNSVFVPGWSYCLKIESDWILDVVTTRPTGETDLPNLVHAKDDAGVAYIETFSQTPQCIRRKVIKVENGRAYYKDTNNSANDFLTGQPLEPGKVHTTVDE